VGVPVTDEVGDQVGVPVVVGVSVAVNVVVPVNVSVETAVWVVVKETVAVAVPVGETVEVSTEVLVNVGVLGAMGTGPRGRVGNFLVQPATTANKARQPIESKNVYRR
jgi:hypothetical protein